jgi:hypothetical protein
MSSPYGMTAHRDRDLERPASGGRCRNESGSILVLTAVILPMLLLFCAIVIDVGYWWVNGKKTQIAADSCALAAAKDLPAPDPGYVRADCVFGSQDYVLINIPQNPTPEVGRVGTRWISTKVKTPYNGSTAMVEATVKMRVRTFFGGLVGVGWIDLTRRAVAEQQSGQGKMAIYVNSVDCDSGESLEFDGKNMHIHGWVHTEGGLYVSVDGSQPPQPNFTAEKGTMALDPAYPTGDVTRCQESINPVNTVADFVPGHPDYLPEGTQSIDWPVWYTPAQFGWYQPAVGTASPNRCRFKGNKIEIENDSIKVDGTSVGPPGIRRLTRRSPLFHHPQPHRLAFGARRHD